jgi:hypothetical protein
VKPIPFLLAFFALLPGSAAAADPAWVDSGTFTITRDRRPLGTERFVYTIHGDSLVITSRVVEVLGHARGVDTLFKAMDMVLKVDDFDLRSYESRQSFLGQRLTRRLAMQDTSFTSFTQINDHGVGTVLVRPPGRILVIDPQVFCLYDVISRNLHGRVFDKRTLLLYVLGVPDTTLEVTATDLGRETIRWGPRSVAARRIQIDDGRNQYQLWLSSKGQMLRLSEPVSNMLIERISPRVKPRPRSRTAG